MFSARIINFRKRIGAGKPPSNCYEFFVVVSCYVIDLRVSLVSSPILHLFIRYVSASGVGNESFVTMYFRFSTVQGRARGRRVETSRGIAICTERVMHTQRQEERKIATVRALSCWKVSTPQIYRVSTNTGINPVREKRTFPK